MTFKTYKEKAAALQAMTDKVAAIFGDDEGVKVEGHGGDVSDNFVTASCFDVTGTVINIEDEGDIANLREAHEEYGNDFIAVADRYYRLCEQA